MIAVQISDKMSLAKNLKANGSSNDEVLFLVLFEQNTFQLYSSVLKKSIFTQNLHIMNWNRNRLHSETVQKEVESYHQNVSFKHLPIM